MRYFYFYKSGSDWGEAVVLTSPHTLKFYDIDDKEIGYSNSNPRNMPEKYLPLRVLRV